MTNVLVSELLLLSNLEKRGRRIAFHPETTIILGGNDTGKSSVVKTIYRTLGAEPAVIHPSWNQAEVTSVLRFSVDGRRYSVLRKEGFYAAFDAEDRLIRAYQSVFRGLGPFLAELFNFQLKLADKKGDLVVPPPAFALLPFYIDQDRSWVENWSGFSRLQQFSGYRKSIAEYHTGIRPNEFYLAQAEDKQLAQQLTALEKEIETLDGIQRRMKDEIGTAQFAVSLEDFRVEVEELIERSRALLQIEEQLKEKLTEKATMRNSLNLRINIVEHALGELNRDFHYATETVTENDVECPTCGALYSNQFAERFAIAQDEERLQDLLIELRAEEASVIRDLSAIENEFNDNRTEVQTVDEILNRRREDVTLSMVLQSEGRKEVDSAFGARRDEMIKDQAVALRRRKEVEEILKRLQDKKRQAMILGEYRSRMRAYLHTLRVDRLSEKSYRAIDSRITESGSDMPRALLAYYFAVLHAIKSYSSSAFFPIVVDSPNQQAQDSLSLVTMLEFIRDSRPQGSQLILAVEDQKGVAFNGQVVEFTERNSVLREQEYEAVYEEIQPMLRSALAGAGESRRSK